MITTAPSFWSWPDVSVYRSGCTDDLTFWESPATTDQMLSSHSVVKIKFRQTEGKCALGCRYISQKNNLLKPEFCPVWQQQLQKAHLHDMLCFCYDVVSGKWDTKLLRALFFFCSVLTAWIPQREREKGGKSDRVRLSDEASVLLLGFCHTHWNFV